MSLFDKEVSIYKNVFDSYGIVLPLRSFLFDQHHKDQVKKLREAVLKSERDQIKKSLPQCCISGVFSPTRRNENLVQHSGLICIDIDGKDNPGIDIAILKKELKKLPQVAYMSLSVSGNGLFLIVPIKYSQHHELVFKSLENDFKRMGVKIDAACKNVSRCRCLSFDHEPYINENATVYLKVAEPPRPVYHLNQYQGNEYEKVREYCRQIATLGIDLTQSYEEWFRIGASLASLGESGREFYHICSSQNPNYSPTETDKKFNNLLKTTNHFSIGTFLHICKERSIFMQV